MKKSRYLFLIVCLLMLSCQQDFGGLDMQQLGNGIGEPDVENQTLINQLENNNSAFEDRLQWVSFIATKVLYADTVARGEFLNLMNKQGTVHFSDLLIENPDNQVFNERFRHFLYDYISDYISLIKPETEMDKPRETILVPPSEDSNDLQGTLEDLVQNAVDYFIEEMTVQNCVEIYFPQPFHFENSSGIASTAHPLQQAVSNEGYHHTVDYSTIAVEVDNAFVDHHQVGMIIARPYSTKYAPCLYEEYEDIDFKNFLSQ